MTYSYCKCSVKKQKKTARGDRAVIMLFKAYKPNSVIDDHISGIVITDNLKPLKVAPRRVYHHSLLPMSRPPKRTFHIDRLCGTFPIVLLPALRRLLAASTTINYVEFMASRESNVVHGVFGLSSASELTAII